MSVKFPVTIKVDNVGAVVMANNIITMPCTKHIDIRYESENEYVKDGVVKIIFAVSSENVGSNSTKS